MTRGAALLSLLTAAFVLAPASTGLAGAAPAAGSAQAQAGVSAIRQDAQLTVASITPEAPREPSTPLTISGSVTNTTAATMSWLSVRLRFSRQPFATRAEMQAFADGGPMLDSVRRTVPVSQLTASGEVPWEFAVTPGELGVFRFGVYPVTLELVDSAGRQLAAQRTFLPYAPKDQTVARTRIAWALPVVDQPHRGDDATFVDDGLRRTLADDGRLGKILKIAETPAKGVSWFVDPAVLDDAQAMARGYNLRSGETTSAEPADPTAARWLQRLREALAEASVSATPYADADVAAITHNGLDGATEVALEKGASVATQVLGKEVGTGVNWPMGGVIDDDGLDALAVGDVRTVLLNATALPPEPPVLYTPDAATSVETVGGRVGVLLADPVLSQLIAAPAPPASGGALLTKQRFLAETAMISVERPQESRAVVAAPPRRWNPDPAFVSDMLRAAASAPWLKPVSLGSLKPPSTSTAVPRAGLLYTEKDRAAELSRSYLAGVKRLNARAGLTAAVTDDHLRVFDTAVLRLTSTAWRGRAPNAAPLVEQLDSAVTERTRMVAITPVERRTLAGDNGVIPITIRNGLEREEVTVGVKITSGDRKLLQIGAYDSPVTINPGGTRQVDIPMVAAGGGQTTVKVQLTSPEGAAYGEPVAVTVHTTGYGGIALVIVGGALTVMLAAVTLRILRRRSRRPARGQRATRPSAPAVPGPRAEPAAQQREGLS
ncbi:DUF6049 family protein [Sphaerisporangium sp. TRM90804]|uniref:DUF6049 family protein n=1 Tax=Sphaerisporangium sp. TRM90804 TaxID=3031113 RepID=UPI00244A6344|nr:DUF6049 family protein [Sphaerisporangium sp. TRM90804]MDH2425547.1 DUF6049 family protein [Sphaerisporangium sp. TRM90804]